MKNKPELKHQNARKETHCLSRKPNKKRKMKFQTLLVAAAAVMTVSAEETSLRNPYMGLQTSVQQLESTKSSICTDVCDVIGDVGKWGCEVALKEIGLESICSDLDNMYDTYGAPACVTLCKKLV